MMRMFPTGDDGPTYLTAGMTEYQNKWRSHPRWTDLAFYVDPGLSCRARSELLAQLLDNLLNNALKYSEAGSPITVQTRRTDNSIVLEVQDCGRVIAQEEVQLIYQPFFRTTAARQSGIVGTGLGLSIVSRIARLLGGRIDCQSVLNQGSVFRVFLKSE